MKKIIFSILCTVLMLSHTSWIYAKGLPMYVNDQFIIRDIQSVAGFDMLPIIDIAGELGYKFTFDGVNLKLYANSQSFYFTIGGPEVHDQSIFYGLAVVPQIIAGKLRIPAIFFRISWAFLIFGIP